MSTDSVIPSGKWEFNEEVTACFDDMLERSIPQYRVMRDVVTRLSLRYLKPGTVLLDLGTSRGTGLAMIRDAARGAGKADAVWFAGTEVSEPMLAAAKERFQGCPDVSVFRHDMRDGVPDLGSYSVITCVLTLQFTPIEYRHRIVNSIFERLDPGGAVILVEKILGSSFHMDSMLVDEYYRGKASNGYDAEKIEAKRRALEGVLVPVTASWNESLLERAGFSEIECVWRWMNFAAWIGVK